MKLIFMEKPQNFLTEALCLYDSCHYKSYKHLCVFMSGLMQSYSLQLLTKHLIYKVLLEKVFFFNGSLHLKGVLLGNQSDGETLFIGFCVKPPRTFKGYIRF